MSTLTASVTPSATGPARTHAPHLTFPRLVRSEWIKFWTVRSSLWILPLTVLAMVGFGALVAYFSTQAQAGGSPEVDVEGAFDASALSSVIVAFAQLTIAVLAVLTITGEYTTGMIRTTLTANPRRFGSLGAKVLVVLSVTSVVSTVGTALTWLVTRPILGSAHAVDLADGETLRILLGAPLYITGIALLAFALGALLRHSAAALATVFGLLLVVETVFQAIPATFFQKVSPFLPGTAGGRIMYSQAAIDAGGADATGAVLSPWQGYGVLVAWGVVLLVAAAVLLRRRDA